MRKGIILAGGLGTRLFPLTKGLSKQLLPVFDKPMIYYPLSNLIMSNIREILIISTPSHIHLYKNLLGDGSKYGIKLQYKIQLEPNGIAHGIILSKKFIKKSDFCLILGDNIFFGPNIKKKFYNSGISRRQTIFIKKIKNPNKYGVMKFYKNCPTKIVEKPKRYISNYAVTGIYYLSNNTIKIAEQLKPSKRKELEITDLNNILLKNKDIFIERLNSSEHWFDAGNHNDYLTTSIEVRNFEKRNKTVVGSIEYESLKMKFLKKKNLFAMSNLKNDYFNKIKKLLR